MCSSIDPTILLWECQQATRPPDFDCLYWWTDLYNKVREYLWISTLRKLFSLKEYFTRHFIEVRSPMNEQRMESYGTIRELMLLNIPLNIKNAEKLLCWVNEKYPHSLMCSDTSCTVPGSLVVGFKTMRKWNLAEESVSQGGDGFEVFYRHPTSCLLFPFSFVCDGNFISNSCFCHVFSSLRRHCWNLTLWNQMQNKLCSLRFFLVFVLFLFCCLFFCLLSRYFITTEN